MWTIACCSIEEQFASCSGADEGIGSGHTNGDRSGAAKSSLSDGAICCNLDFAL